MIGTANSSGSGGVGSDECTLTLQDVPKGLKAVTKDSDDEAMDGKLDTNTTASDSQVLTGQTYFKYNSSSKHWEKCMGKQANNPSPSAKLNCGESKIIPAGFNPGGTVTANSLASQTPGNLVANKMLAGTYGISNGARVDGNIASISGPSITPQTYGQAINMSGRYLTSNGYVTGVALPPASALKKGYRYRIGDNFIDGEFEGYISDTIYLYNYGTWSNMDNGGMTVVENSQYPERGSWAFNSNNIYLNQRAGKFDVSNNLTLRTNATVDITNFKFLKSYINTNAYNPSGDGAWSSASIGISKPDGTKESSAGTTISQTGTLILDISKVTGYHRIVLNLYNCGRAVNATYYTIYLTNV